ncbi:hypothetical protein Q9233_001382 [Columba guinea]|nr:hypothetical protein Q9233_001382 [Columba guinea]
MLLTRNMEPLLGVLLGLILAAASSAQNNCTCASNKWTVCAQNGPENCTCTLEKCFQGHPRGLLDIDGIYSPDCEDSGIFKARQCNQADACWCVNTPGIRITEKVDKSLRCDELVRTSWIYIQLKHKKKMSGAWDAAHVANALKQLFESRYKLHPKYIAAIKYYSPLIQIDLKQHDSGKSDCDVDTADVACYFEEDIKDDSIFHSNSTLTVSTNGDALDIERIYYMGEKPSLFSLNQRGW